MTIGIVTTNHLLQKSVNERLSEVNNKEKDEEIREYNSILNGVEADEIANTENEDGYKEYYSVQGKCSDQVSSGFFGTVSRIFSSVGTFCNGVFSGISEFFGNIFSNNSNVKEETENSLVEEDDLSESTEENNSEISTDYSSSEWDGTFVVNDGHSINTIISTGRNHGSDETKSQYLTENEDGTFTITTYYKNEDGCDDIPDEVETVEIVQETIEGIDFSIPKVVTTDIEYNIDSKIDYVKQGSEGDCWLLSALNSFSYSEKGQEFIENAITNNGDGSYSVTFDGIGQTYTVTSEELQQARENEVYSTGDNTALLFEVAVEKALNYCINEYEYDLMGITPSSETTNILLIKGEYAKRREEEKSESLLYGGNLATIDRLFVLTDFSIEAYNSAEHSSSNIESVLDNIDIENSVTSVSFSTNKNLTSDSGNEFTITDHHAYTIKSYDKDAGKITIVNPWNNSETLTTSIDTLRNDIGNISYLVLE